MNKNIFNIGDSVTVLNRRAVGEIVGLRRWTITDNDGEPQIYEWRYWICFNNSVESYEEWDVNKYGLADCIQEIENSLIVSDKIKG